MTRQEELDLIATLAQMGITPSKLAYTDGNEIPFSLWKHRTIKKASERVFKDNSIAYFPLSNSSA